MKFATMAAVFVAGLALAGSAAGQDVQMGEQVFRQCALCHEIGDGARNRQGPVLTGIVGRKAASIEDFPYSEALKAAGADGLVWTPEALGAFVAAPRHFQPGTGMIFRGLKSEADVADVIAYLQSLQTADAAQLAVGRTLLEDNCSGCHAIGATGTSPHEGAPPFRELKLRYPVEDLTEALVEGLVSGHPDMPEFTFEPDEAEAIVAYLKSLG